MELRPQRLNGKTWSTSDVQKFWRGPGGELDPHFAGMTERGGNKTFYIPLP